MKIKFLRWLEERCDDLIGVLRELQRGLARERYKEIVKERESA